MKPAASTISEVEPFLKWPGGKRWLASFLVPTLRAECSNTYIEPFLGGGAVFLFLAPKRAFLSDINSVLIGCWKAVQKNPCELVEMVWKLSNSRSCYYKIRSSEPLDNIGRAVKFIYLNKTCWGGIYRLNKEGKFNVPFGDSGRVICRKRSLVECANVLKKASVQCCDFEVAMKDAGKGDVIYADPPYTTRGESNGFVRYNERLFAWADQMRLATAGISAAKRGAFVAVSGLWHKHIAQLYPGWFAIRIRRNCLVSRKIASRAPVTEMVVFSKRPKHIESKFVIPISDEGEINMSSAEFALNV